MTGKPYRLAQSGGTGRHIDRTKPLHFTFDGVAMEGFAGDTVASAVMASGRRVLGRSFKYHRPRGIIGLGSDEPNGLISIGEGGRHEPNLRATQVELYDGLVAKSQNRWPSLDFDVGAVNNWLSRLFPGGFYYKTFMWPQAFWRDLYEPVIRRAAGLGTAADSPDPDCYEQIHVHCDVLVAGAGVAGLRAAQAAAAAGARVIIADETAHPGGISDLGDETIENRPAAEWARAAWLELARTGNVHVLARTTVSGHYHDNYLLMAERVCDHDPVAAAAGTPRHRLWKVRARQVIVATGALERPVTFANNDRPGVMLSSAVRGLAQRQGVAAGKRGVVFTNNDDAYRTALVLAKAGVDVARIIDIRKDPQSALTERAKAAGIAISFASAIAGVAATSGGKIISSVKVAGYEAGGGPVTGGEDIACDFVAMSGGWNPAVHLWCHNSGKLKFDEASQSFRPLSHGDAIAVVGAANGTLQLADILTEAAETGERAAAASGNKAGNLPRVHCESTAEAAQQAIWFAPAAGKYHRGNKHFLDFQNDVTAADVQLAQREGYTSVEHTKRYTTLGMATDQGKTSNINGLGIIAQARGKAIPDIGTTTFRPPYTPVSFGAIAGTQVGGLFLPVRRTSAYDWHKTHNADFEPVGHWRRSYCYRNAGETRTSAIHREILAVRQSVGLLDASTLGKIELKGADAGIFLDRIYTNMFSTLAIGRCRYGLMLNELGFLMDDGVTVRLGKDHYLMHTTSGGADTIAAWLEEWLQTEWPELKVYITPVTEQWAQFAIAGPMARKVLEKLGGDIALGHEDMAFMTMQEGTIGGYQVRLFRISFSGELSFEIATPAHHGLGLWRALLSAGKEFGICAYGTEALHILRAEKGFIVVGDETDGTVTPLDVGMSWAVSKKKADFIGKRSLQQAFLKAGGRKQLVGLETEDASEVLPDGAYAVDEVKAAPPMKMIGHVTSSYWSPTLKRSIAMALIEGGQARMGEMVSFPLEGKTVQAKIVDPVFYDKKGARQNV